MKQVGTYWLDSAGDTYTIIEYTTMADQRLMVNVGYALGDHYRVELTWCRSDTPSTEAAYLLDGIL